MQLRTILMTAAACLAAAGAARGQQAVQMDRTVDVQPGTRLQLDNHFGDVTIRTWDRSAVRVQGSHPVGTTVEVQQGGSLLQIEADRPGSHASPITYTLTVPADMPIEVEVIQGDVDVAGTRAGMDIQSVHGSITVVGGAGVLALESVQGLIKVTGARGRVNATSVNQGIELSDIRGDVQAEAVNGRIHMQGIDAGRVSAETVNGSVSYEGAVRNDGWYRFSTHNGGIDLTIPSNAGATFTASTFNGTLHTAFPVTLHEAKEGKEFTFTLGSGGARIELESFNGTMTIRRP
ncbi:MAG TPA: DUF4097 family beta strand repeat-containing protein [Gemmatimonadota bacterium]|nr:DUF4097 family beta strand repeat-containing protein [Gemmatimonadota bacterium]